MRDMFPTPTLDDVRGAARRIARWLSPTPFIRSAWLSRITHGEVWLKLEIAQPTGSFKIRGALNALTELRARAPGTAAVITASAGNHGLAIAWAASELGTRVQVYLPASAPAAKRQALAGLGAEITEAESYEHAEASARRASLTTGIPFISPYNHPDVIAGAGTVALEILDARPSLDAIIAPVGGGGLLSGIAIVGRETPCPVGRRLVVGAEAAASPAFTAALEAGRTVTVPVTATLADGLAGNMEPDSRTFDIVRDLADRVVLVRETSIARAMAGLIEHERLIAEGAGAAAVGALLQGDLDLSGRETAVILSGRNVDLSVLRRILQPLDAAE
jgi:threonine dehydratase